MKPLLLHRDRDFDLQQPLPDQHADLVQDLGLDVLFDAMAGGDALVREVVERVVLTGLDDPAAVEYRQQVLTDCLAQPQVVRDLYRLAVDTAAGDKKIWGFGFRSPNAILHRSVELLEFLVGQLKLLRQVVDDSADLFVSPGWRTFCATVAAELDAGYFAEVDEHLRRLRFRDGVTLSAELGAGNRGTGYVLRTPRRYRRSLVDQLAGRGRPRSYTLRIPDRDQAGANALSELRDRGVNLVANALAQSTDHVLSFFDALRTELGFYIGCLRLHDELAERAAPTCLPQPLPATSPRFSCAGLYDPCLRLSTPHPVVGNDVDADGKVLVVVTGANNGGKSTFLRSVGIAQLMMRSGMFAPAVSLRADLCRELLTHYRREEDSELRSGKLDEELARMSRIADRVRTGSLVLLNESFGATNEREGSEIARQIMRALLESGVRVWMVTHFYDLAHGWFEEQRPDTLFLRAERTSDGRRTFRLQEGEPLPTSYGADRYAAIFGPAPAPPRKATPHPAR